MQTHTVLMQRHTGGGSKRAEAFKSRKAKRKKRGLLVSFLGIEPQRRVQLRDGRKKGRGGISKAIRQKFRLQYSWFRNSLEEHDHHAKKGRSRKATVMDKVVEKTWVEMRLPLALGAIIFASKYLLGPSIQSFLDSAAWHSFLNILLTITIVMYVQNQLGRIVKNVRDEERAKRTRKSFKDLEGLVGATHALAWGQESRSVRVDRQLATMQQKLDGIERQLNARPPAALKAPSGAMAEPDTRV